MVSTFKQDSEPEEDNDFDLENEITEESDVVSLSEEENEEVKKQSSQQQKLWIERGISDIPENIHQAIRVKSDVICKAIIKVLEQRPKFSSVREKIPTYILKLWNIRTRGKPREQFAKRVDQQIAIMDRKGYVIIYKSKNERVKLAWVRYQDN